MSRIFVFFLLLGVSVVFAEEEAAQAAEQPTAAVPPEKAPEPVVMPPAPEAPAEPEEEPSPEAPVDPYEPPAEPVEVPPEAPTEPETPTESEAPTEEPEGPAANPFEKFEEMMAMVAEIVATAQKIAEATKPQQPQIGFPPLTIPFFPPMPEFFPPFFW